MLRLVLVLTSFTQLRLSWPVATDEPLKLKFYNTGSRVSFDSKWAHSDLENPFLSQFNFKEIQFWYSFDLKIRRTFRSNLKVLTILKTLNHIGKLQFKNVNIHAQTEQNRIELRWKNKKGQYCGKGRNLLWVSSRSLPWSSWPCRCSRSRRSPFLWWRSFPRSPAWTWSRWSSRPWRRSTWSLPSWRETKRKLKLLKQKTEFEMKWWDVNIPLRVFVIQRLLRKQGVYQPQVPTQIQLFLKKSGIFLKYVSEYSLI